MFSVIIPTYNRATFVTKAVDSILRQSFKDYEIIVVDDGSTDTTSQQLDRYGKKITRIYQANSGVGAARNAGIRKANGTWIAFLDSDDLWIEDKLEAQIRGMTEKNADVVTLEGRDHIAEVLRAARRSQERSSLLVDGVDEV